MVSGRAFSFPSQSEGTYTSLSRMYMEHFAIIVMILYQLKLEDEHMGIHHTILSTLSVFKCH